MRIAVEIEKGICGSDDHDAVVQYLNRDHIVTILRQGADLIFRMTTDAEIVVSGSEEELDALLEDLVTAASSNFVAVTPAEQAAQVD